MMKKNQDISSRGGPGDMGGHFDISGALKGWNFQQGQINVRVIRGNDGKPKLQLRLDLGLLQMELHGRPDGRRPHRAVTELDFHARKLRKYRDKNGSDMGFVLSGRDCQALREESAMFYHRYLSLFVLEQYDAVIRDTQHNLNVLDMCHQYGKSDFDRMCLEQYRPYVMMMQTRAMACQAVRDGYLKTAAAYLRSGVRRILRLVPREHRRRMREESSEVNILAEMLRQVRRQLPPDPHKQLRERLSEAVKAERYEEAASLRDQLIAIQTVPPALPPSILPVSGSTSDSEAVHAGTTPPVKNRKPRKKKDN